MEHVLTSLGRSAKDRPTRGSKNEKKNIYARLVSSRNRRQLKRATRPHQCTVLVLWSTVVVLQLHHAGRIVTGQQSLHRVRRNATSAAFTKRGPNLGIFILKFTPRANIWFSIPSIRCRVKAAPSDFKLLLSRVCLTQCLI